MANHISGDKTQADKLDQPIDYEEAARILDSAPVIPVTDDKAEWRKLYASADRGEILIKNQPHTKAGYGFYGEYAGNSLFAPPIEFDGYGGNGYGIDAYSHPGRYGYGYGGGGYTNKEGWVYGRGKNNIDHMRIAQCRLLYKTEGVVQTLVHLLADFATEQIDLVHADDTVHKFYQAWKTKVNLQDRLHRFVVDLLTTGQVFIWTKQATLKTSEKTAMKRQIAAQLIGNELVVSVGDEKGKVLRDKTIHVEIQDDCITLVKELNKACATHASDGCVNEVTLQTPIAEGGTRNAPTDPQHPDKQNTAIPWQYISLNPLQMEPRGSRFANEHYWVMLLSQRDMKPLSRFMNYRYYSDISTTKVNLPEIFKGKLTPIQNKNSPYAAELRLDEDRLSVIHDITKTDYEDWATPQIYPAHKEVTFKRMMRQAEVSAMESLKHAITLIKLGKVEEGFIPTEDQIERVATALAGGSQTHHLVWDDLIDGKILQPNVGNIFDPKKYTQVDKDIYAALGVSESVMTGNGSYANSFMSIKLLLEKLETIRNKLQDWLLVEIKKIADAMKFRRLPIIQWGLMNLRDENAERKLWLDLYDRGIVSDTSILERFGSDFDIEAARQTFEKTFKEDSNPDIKKDDETFRAPVMISKGPFSRDTIKSKPSAGPGGRPIKTGTPQTQKRSTKPKGMGRVLEFQRYYEFACNAVKFFSDIVNQKVVETQGVKDFRSLSKAQKTEVEEIILYTLAASDPTKDLDQNLVYDVLKGENNEIFSTEKCRKIVAFYKTEVSQTGSKEERLDLMANCFAAMHSGVLDEKVD